MKLSKVCKLYLRQNIPLNTTLKIPKLNVRFKNLQRKILSADQKDRKTTQMGSYGCLIIIKHRKLSHRYTFPRCTSKPPNKHEISTVEPFPLHDCGLVHTSPFLSFMQRNSLNPALLDFFTLIFCLLFTTVWAKHMWHQVTGDGENHKHLLQSLTYRTHSWF